MWGPGSRFGIVPIGGGETYWFAVRNAQAGGADAPASASSARRTSAAGVPAPARRELERACGGLGRWILAGMTDQRFRHAFLIVLVAAISAAFLTMVRDDSALDHPGRGWRAGVGASRHHPGFAGDLWRAVGLAVFCALIVGGVDNLLRPRLVGRDTQMQQLLIFFSTLGGLGLFGAAGFILGPVLAALFVTAWEMVGVAFRRELTDPPVGGRE
jgi:hypothetical protein